MNFTQKEQKKCSEIKEKYYEGCIDNRAFEQDIYKPMESEELKETVELLKSGELYKRFLQNKESDTIK